VKFASRVGIKVYWYPMWSLRLVLVLKSTDTLCEVCISCWY